jgi:hypothetical protein
MPRQSCAPCQHGVVRRPDESDHDPAPSASDSEVVAKGSLNGQPDRKTSWVQRLLDNKTGLQRAVISLGALAAALIAIGGVVAAVVRVFGDDGGGRSSLERTPGETQRIESGTPAADEFVSDLLDHDGGVVALNHQVAAEKGPADVRLQYDCSDTGVCVMVRLQDIAVAAGDMADGLWFVGCFAVTQDGVGYGAVPLDIELKHQGEACP